MGAGLPSEFTKAGLLEPGEHSMALEQLRLSMFVTGPRGARHTWDRDWRAHLVENLALLAHQLWQVGIDEIFIDGSFVEDKDHPNDIDGYFVCEGTRLKELKRELNLLDEDEIWTWGRADKLPCGPAQKKKLPMWCKYRIELYPHHGQVIGLDKLGNEIHFPAFFRKHAATGQPKGIVRLVKGGEA